ncbi:MAG: DMT family transporter [Schwartzia sp.]|nr:DMT family transporter [Schwartzia sp. (in: firmicutes)]MBR1886634.1 DMT family transporter [Schwartzia sp. (in: firmicutes)]
MACRRSGVRSPSSPPLKINEKLTEFPVGFSFSFREVLLLRWRGNGCLLVAAFIWGTTFVAQSVGMENIGPFTYGSARFFLGVLALGILWLLAGGQKTMPRTAESFRVGAAAGVLMFAASALQQYGMLYTTVGKASFLTCLYLIFVPLAGVFLRQSIRAEHWAGAVLALAGLYFLCVTDGLSLGFGDALELCGAFFWTAHILFIDRFAARAETIAMSLAQVAVVFLLNTATAAMCETAELSAVTAAWFPIFYAGVLSTGVAFTLQIVGQREADPAPAAVIMSLESVFGTLAGWIVLGEALSPREMLGCVLMGAGMLAAQAGGYALAAWKKRR